MQNAHLRIAKLEYMQSSKSFSTRVQAFCDRFVLEGSRCLMVSYFGNDAEISAISAAVSSNQSLSVKLPDGAEKNFNLGEKVVNYRGSIQIPGHPRPVRHVLSFAEEMLQNGMEGKVYLLNNDPRLIWSTVISFLGLPATPEWATEGVKMLTHRKKINELEGFNCSPSVVTVGREELLSWIGEQVKAGVLPFPDKPGPIIWPEYDITDLIRIHKDDENEVEPPQAKAA
jgi:hypothetical protein